MLGTGFNLDGVLALVDGLVILVGAIPVDHVGAGAFGRAADGACDLDAEFEPATKDSRKNNLSNFSAFPFA
jgi:hypothetical protein